MLGDLVGLDLGDGDEAALAVPLIAEGSRNSEFAVDPRDRANLGMNDVLAI